MKTVLAIVLAVCFSPIAGAQSNPVTNRPTMPSSAKPAMPSSAKPAMPSSAKPAPPAPTPHGHILTAPEQPAPAVPTVPSSALCSPAQPVLDLSTRPEPDSFRPFHSTASVAYSLVMPPAPAMPIGRRTIAELRKEQAGELKALKKSLKGSPQVEFDRAVEAKKAEQSAAIKALLAADHAITSGPQKNTARQVNSEIK